MLSDEEIKNKIAQQELENKDLENELKISIRLTEIYCKGSISKFKANVNLLLNDYKNQMKNLFRELNKDKNLLNKKNLELRRLKRIYKENYFDEGLKKDIFVYNKIDEKENIINKLEYELQSLKQRVWSYEKNMLTLNNKLHTMQRKRDYILSLNRKILNNKAKIKLIKKELNSPKRKLLRFFKGVIKRLFKSS